VRFKLDENLPSELASLFREFGHDAVTVLDQGMGGTDDSDLASACAREQRVLVTLDKDFSDIRTYPPKVPGLQAHRIGLTTTMVLSTSTTPEGDTP
jgi:predicted nuclease of predicted toxin-antitoxin system